MVVPGNKRMPNRPGNANNAKRFKPGNPNRRMNMGAITNDWHQIHQISQINQIPSNGYLDFTEPTNVSNNSNNSNSNNQKQFKNNVGGNNINKNRNRGNNNNGQRQQGGMNNGNIRWGNNNRGRDMPMNNNRNNNMNNNMRQGNMMHGGQFGTLLGPRMHPMGMPPPPPMGMLPPLPPPMPPIHNGRFGPRPLMPPIGGMGPGPIRRPPNFRMGPGPFPNRGMLPRNGAAGPVRRTKVASGMVSKTNRRNGGNQPPNQKNRKKNQMKNGKRTNQNVNKYALEKPWVNDEIREAHKIKTDLENQLKGKKNDEIFAKFKEQRDKFVNLYDAAKQAFITTQKEDKEKVLKESDTGEQTDTKKDVEMPNANAAS